LPIVGQAPGWDNVYLATGGEKKGILLTLHAATLCYRVSMSQIVPRPLIERRERTFEIPIGRTMLH
jgi:hypothetical protein